MSRLYASLAALTVLASSARAQEVAYEKYMLENGLTVILHEDHALPQVVVDLWYRVGSKDERPGRSGFAHLFEHLMFMGTERVPGLDFDNLMEAGGGFNNATTSTDRTNYFDVGPAELLPTLLWLEADRLQDVGRMMTQEKLDKQRDVVRNERRQTGENQPYGKARLKSTELMYPRGHPYHLPVIGSHADLKAATVDDVKQFFTQYYVPNNAALVVAGDFDPAEVKRMVADLFGTLPRGADVLHRTAAPATLEEDLVFTSTDAVQFALTSFLWHSPPHYADGDAELDLLAAVLSDGISSRLYQRLVVQKELAVSVSAFQSSRILGSTFQIDALARPEVALETLEAEINDVLHDLLQGGVTAEELDRRKVQFERRTLQGLQSLFRKADALNRYELYFGEPDSFARDLDRYRNATPDDVRRWAARVLSTKRLVMRVLPEAPEPETDPRDTRPVVGAPPNFEPAAPETFALSNGLPVMHWERPGIPLVQVALVLPRGAACDAKPGTAQLTADMLDEGTGDLSAVELTDALERLGASVSTDVTRDSTTIGMLTLARNFDPALDLVAAAIQRPALHENEWERVHDLHLQGLKRSLDEPTDVAQVVAMRAFFGDDHPYGRPVQGTLASVEGVSLADVRAFHSAAYRPSGAVLLVAGAVSASDAKAALEARFGGWQDPAAPAPTPAASVQPAEREPRLLVVDRPGAVQTVVRFTMPCPTYSDPQRTARQLIATILGGTFTSRLNKNLREEHGYSYGARARFLMEPDAGYAVAYSSVRTDVTGASLGEFLKEFDAIRSGDISEVEAGKARATLRNRSIAAFEGLAGILGAAELLVRNDLSFDAFARDLAATAAVTREELNRLAPEAVALEDSLLVLVGDRSSIMEQLEGLRLPPAEEVDVNGDPVSSH